MMPDPVCCWCSAPGGAICLFSFRFQHFFTPKMKRPLLGKSLLSLASPLLDSSSPVAQPLKAPAVRPLPRHWGFKQGKMDLEGIPSQSSIHPSSVFHTITCLTACRAFLPPLSPSLLFFCFVSHYSTWL